MSLTINGTEILDKCTALEGLTFFHVYFSNMRDSTKDFLQNIQEESVYVSYSDDDEFFEYQNARIIYLGNNTIYVCSWIN